jgi:hypothetical protein
MALTPLASTVIGGSHTFFPGITNEAANEAYVIGYGTSFLHRYSLTTFAEVASTSMQSNSCGIALINSASAVGVSSTTGNAQFYEISSGYTQTISAGSTSQGNNQNIAGDPTNNTVMFISSGTRTLHRIVNFTYTSLTINTGATNDGAMNCIIAKSPGRWLLGTQGGAVYEMDSSGNILNRLQISLDNTSGAGYFETNSAVAFLPISNLAYDNNLLLIGCGDGTCLVYDLTTQTKIYQYQINSNSQNRGILFSPAASGEVVAVLDTTQSNPGRSVCEMDFTVKPLKFYDSMYTNSTNTPQAVGINTQTSVGWFTQTDASSVTRIYFFRISGVRPTTTQLFTVNPGGVDQKARLLLLDDTSGNTVGRTVLDTYMQSPATYRVPSGKSLIAAVKVGEGEDATFQANSDST